MDRKLVTLIGAGRVGIRHLAGILSVEQPLSIVVVDSSDEVLTKARELGVPERHRISYVTKIPKSDHLDLAIIATTSRDRAAATRTLLKNTKSLPLLILEKILFDKRADYLSIENLLKRRRIKTWVHHPRRLYPFHKAFAKSERGKKFFYHIRSGNKNTLMTNITHFVDYFAHLAGSQAFAVDVSMLNRTTIPSRRKGYLEVYGSVVFRFPNGSVGITTCLPQTAPFAGDYMSATTHATFNETGGTVQIAHKKNKWKWGEESAPLTPIGDLIGPVVTDLLTRGDCELPTYKSSANIHLRVFEPIRKHLKLQTYQFS